MLLGVWGERFKLIKVMKVQRVSKDNYPFFEKEHFKHDKDADSSTM